MNNLGFVGNEVLEPILYITEDAIFNTLVAAKECEQDRSMDDTALAK